MTSAAASADPAVHPPPKVVACVPCWNAGAFIADTLASLAAQTYPNLEILISDDCSTDDTLTICRNFAAGHPAATVITQEKNLGWAGNVDALLAQAEGDYLLFAFHDDILDASYVAKTVAALDSNPGAVLAYTDVRLHDADGSSSLRIYEELDGLRNAFDRGRRLVARRGHWFVPTRGLFRSAAARRIGGFRKHRRGEYEADWVWLTRMALLGVFVRVPEVLCDKYYKPNSRSKAADWSHDSDSKVAVMESMRWAIRESDLREWEKSLLVLRLWPRLARHRLASAATVVLSRRRRA